MDDQEIREELGKIIEKSRQNAKKANLDTSPIGLWALITSSYRMNRNEESILKEMLGVKNEDF